MIGVLLFALFINDLPESVKSAVKLFTDDVKLTGDANDSAGIQEDLDSISTWKNGLVYGIQFREVYCYAYW